MRFELTCAACPEQYDVYVGDQEVAYVRLRHGILYAEVPFDGKVVFEHDFGDERGSFLDEVERQVYLKKIEASIRKELQCSI